METERRDFVMIQKKVYSYFTAGISGLPQHLFKSCGHEIAHKSLRDVVLSFADKDFNIDVKHISMIAKCFVYKCRSTGPKTFFRDFFNF